MNVYYNTDCGFQKTAVAIGKFDGVHLGHMQLLNATVSASIDLTPAVFTFNPHPEQFYKKDIKTLTTHQQRNALFEAAGIKICYYATFNNDFAELLPDEFFNKYIVKIMGAKQIFVGTDFKFGKNRNGNSETLRELSAFYNIKCTIIDHVMAGDNPVSSTRIRNYILNGEMEEAKYLLGRNFSCTGMVVEGNKLGRTIGFPTANLNVDNELLPPDGVYSAHTYYNGNLITGMLYIGKPTIVKTSKKTFEIHFFNFNENLYGKNLEIFISKRIRDVIKFSSVDNLKKQLVIDELDVKLYFQSHQT